MRICLHSLDIITMLFLTVHRSISVYVRTSKDFLEVELPILREPHAKEPLAIMKFELFFGRVLYIHPDYGSRNLVLQLSYCINSLFLR